MRRNDDRRPRVTAVLIWSAVVWTALWHDVSVANVLWGVVVGALTLWIAPVPLRATRVTLRPLGVLRFALFAAWSLVQASAVVAWEVVTPQNRINQGIVAAPLRTRSPGVTTLIANVISLTPGTLTLQVRGDPPTLYVHILHLRSIEAVRGDIQRLEELAMRAFPLEDGETRPEDEPSTS